MSYANRTDIANGWPRSVQLQIAQPAPDLSKIASTSFFLDNPTIAGTGHIVAAVVFSSLLGAALADCHQTYSLHVRK